MIRDSTSSSVEWRVANSFEFLGGEGGVAVATPFLACGVALYFALLDSLEAGIGGVRASGETVEGVASLTGTCSFCGGFSAS